MKLSVSNLAFPRGDVFTSSAALLEAGVSGVEIAPTLLWSNAPKVDVQVEKFLSRLKDSGLEVSGIQSLLYGHPELQLFNRESWPDLRDHLRGMVRLAAALDASVAVFGSPKNRIRGEISLPDAHQLAAEFFSSLVPDLEDNQVVLTLEPNAPSYGCDYLVHYYEVVEVSTLIDSSFIQPQIDTGCLAMVKDDFVSAVFDCSPGHVHVSAAGLSAPARNCHLDSLSAALRSIRYEGWVTLEMLEQETNPTARAIECCRWMSNVFGNSNVK